jgi:hypothetical protein
MKSMMALALLAAGLLALPAADVAQADGYRYSHNYAKRAYRGSIRQYRNLCTYGDCLCIRRYALATGSPVWWDRYQACTG